MSQEIISNAFHYYLEGNFAEAAKLCGVILVESQDIDGYSKARIANLLGIMLLERGDAASALPLLRFAALSSSFIPEFYHNYGIALMRAGHEEDAIACFQHAIAIGPESPMRAHPPLWRSNEDGTLILELGFTIDRAYAESAQIRPPALMNTRT
jgi:tetratricopeptide (TPR) repeat protein